MIKQSTSKLILPNKDNEVTGNCLSLVYPFIEQQDYQPKQYDRSDLISCQNCQFILTEQTQENVYSYENYIQILDANNGLQLNPPDDCAWKCPICDQIQKLSKGIILKDQDFNIKGQENQDDQNQENTLIILLDYSGSMNSNVNLTQTQKFEEISKKSRIVQAYQDSQIKSQVNNNINKSKMQIISKQQINITQQFSQIGPYQQQQNYNQNMQPQELQQQLSHSVVKEKKEFQKDDNDNQFDNFGKEPKLTIEEMKKNIEDIQIRITNLIESVRNKEYLKEIPDPTGQGLTPLGLKTQKEIVLQECIKTQDIKFQAIFDEMKRALKNYKEQGLDIIPYEQNLQYFRQKFLQVNHPTPSFQELQQQQQLQMLQQMLYNNGQMNQNTPFGLDQNNLLNFQMNQGFPQQQFQPFGQRNAQNMNLLNQANIYQQEQTPFLQNQMNAFQNIDEPLMHINSLNNLGYQVQGLNQNMQYIRQQNVPQQLNQNEILNQQLINQTNARNDIKKNNKMLPIDNLQNTPTPTPMPMPQQPQIQQGQELNIQQIQQFTQKMMQIPEMQEKLQGIPQDQQQQVVQMMLKQFMQNAQQKYQLDDKKFYTKKDILITVLDNIIQEQISILNNKQKKQKIAFILFNNLIYAIGDGSNQEYLIYSKSDSKKQLNITQQLQETDLIDEKRIKKIPFKYSEQNLNQIINEGRQVYQNFVLLNIDQCYQKLHQHLNDIESSSSTALGPALSLALGMAKEEPNKGTQIIIVTDGKANKGFGKIEGLQQFKSYKDNATQIYNVIAQQALDNSISIHIVSIKGEEKEQFGLKQLKPLLQKTGGENIEVDPENIENFEQQFKNLTKKKVISVQTTSRIYITLQQDIELKKAEQKGIQQKQYYYECQLGNLFYEKEKEIAIGIIIKNPKNIDLEQTFVIQVQTQYSKVNNNQGSQLFVSTKQFSFTRKLIDHIKNLDLDVVTVNFIQDLSDEQTQEFSGKSKCFDQLQQSISDEEQDEKSQYFQKLNEIYQNLKMEDKFQQCQQRQQLYKDQKLQFLDADDETDKTVTLEMKSKEFSSKEFKNKK